MYLEVNVHASYYPPILQYTFDVIQIERTNTHEAKCLEQRHVHILRLVVVNCFVVRVLSDHRHFALGH
jgi:hypothetical protein